MKRMMIDLFGLMVAVSSGKSDKNVEEHVGIGILIKDICWTKYKKYQNISKEILKSEQAYNS
jgi:hypothetical protein